MILYGHSTGFSGIWGPKNGTRRKEASFPQGTKNTNSRKLSGLMLLLFSFPCVLP